MARRGNPQIIVRLPQAKIDQLQSIAACFEQTLSDIVREGVDMVIAHYFDCVVDVLHDDVDQLRIDEK